MPNATRQPAATASPPSWDTASRLILKAAAVFWFAITFLGQILFATAIALTYGAPAVRGDFSGWNKATAHGYVAGEHFANAVVAIHLLAALLIVLCGSLQLVPAIQRRAPRFHRWNGRIYIVLAFSVSLAGIYMLLGRGTFGTTTQHLGQLLNGVLILAFAVMAWRTAVARDFNAHRRWALRLYLTVSAALFVRAATFLTLSLPSPYGFDPATFAGPWLNFLSFAQYLVPLALLQLYLVTQARPKAVLRFATSGVLFVFTLALGLGTAATLVASWTPKSRAALDARRSIADALATTLDAHGADAALRQYLDLKASAVKVYNFDEPELNTLGYQLLRQQRFADAIRVFQWNVQSFPNSANVYDSLGEAYANSGDKPNAIAAYRRSLQLNPRNGNAELMLKKLALR